MEKYQSPMPAEAVADIARVEGKFFSVRHKEGYYQCPLVEASQLMTNSSHHSANLSISGHLMGYHQLQSIITAEWLIHLRG